MWSQGREPPADEGLTHLGMRGGTSLGLCPRPSLGRVRAHTHTHTHTIHMHTSSYTPSAYSPSFRLSQKGPSNKNRNRLLPTLKLTIMPSCFHNKFQTLLWHSRPIRFPIHHLPPLRSPPHP